MSVKKWNRLAEERRELAEQEREIRQKIKMNKINKAFGQISGEELFKPITKRLDKAATKDPEPEPEPAEELDYGMDEFDRLNPFAADFRPDAETPPPTPAPTPPPTPPPEEEASFYEDAASSPPPEEEKRKTWAAPAATRFLESSSESTDLGTVKQLITKFSGNPEYRVKSGKFQGKSIKDLEKIRDEILMRRDQLPKEATRGPLDDTSWEMEGSGVGASDGDKLIEQLYVSLGSIRAGNTSTKLRKQVVDLLRLLTKHGAINEYQRQKIYNDYIAS